MILLFCKELGLIGEMGIDWGKEPFGLIETKSILDLVPFDKKCLLCLNLVSISKPLLFMISSLLPQTNNPPVWSHDEYLLQI